MSINLDRSSVGRRTLEHSFLFDLINDCFDRGKILTRIDLYAYLEVIFVLVNRDLGTNRRIRSIIEPARRPRLFEIVRIVDSLEQLLEKRSSFSYVALFERSLIFVRFVRRVSVRL